MSTEATSAVEEVFKKYPELAQRKLRHLRSVIIATANEMDDVNGLEETLKWGEPSFLTRHGSTIRIDWKEKTPRQYAIYFKCTSKLVPTFRRVFPDKFKFEGNRAIVFELNEEIPEADLKKCIAAALTYHKVKHISNLGIVAT